MNSISSVAAILALISIAGCDQQQDQPVKAPDTGVLKTQLDTLEQAKHLEQSIQDAAVQQRQKIEEGTQ